MFNKLLRIFLLVGCVTAVNAASGADDEGLGSNMDGYSRQVEAKYNLIPPVDTHTTRSEANAELYDQAQNQNDTCYRTLCKYSCWEWVTWEPCLRPCLGPTNDAGGRVQAGPRTGDWEVVGARDLPCNCQHPRVRCVLGCSLNLVLLVAILSPASLGL